MKVLVLLLEDVLNEFGDFIDQDPDPNSSNFVDPDPDTINPDPHPWSAGSNY